MVELANKRSPQSPVATSGTAVSDLPTVPGYQPHVKLEADDCTDSEECSSSFKRAKLMVPFQQQQWITGSISLHPQATYFNPLEEPSPLGLRLRKTPSLLDLIQMKLSQGDPACSGDVNNRNQEAGKRKDARSTMVQAGTDKLKASNFPASVLRIGTWQCVSKYEGDLVAKCYFAKHKLVWEVLDRGLKSKIEIQWSDITALRASYPENGPGTLDIEVSRPPLFFRETNPQPRKHTLWQATSDFTGGQATICKQHFLQCPQGLLNRHYEKLIQCDPRLNLLSKKAVMSRDSPYFDSRSAAFQVEDEQIYYGTVKENKCNLLPQFDHLKNEYFTPLSSFQDAPLPMVPKHEPLDSEGGIVESTPQETPSPSSVMDSRAIEENGNGDNDDLNTKGVTQWEQLRFLVPRSGLLDQGSGLALSTSVSTLVNQIGLLYFQEQKRSCNSLSTCEGAWSSNTRTLDALAQHLLGDSILSVTSDEQSVMARVNSMCSLIQKDVSVVHALQKNAGKFEDSVTGYSLGKFIHNGVGDEVKSEEVVHVPLCEVDNITVDCKQTTIVSRKESSGDLLLHLPRIASLPQLFVKASDEMVMRNEPPGMVGGNRFR